MNVLEENAAINNADENDGDSCCSSVSCCGPKTPTVRAASKVGRNDPCPCDSGIKFKKCCGKKGV